MTSGTEIRVTLLDGTTLTGTVQRSLAWWRYTLTNVQASTPQGDVEAAGVFTIPKRAVLFIQHDGRGE